mmetsp:Transcript_25492/g.60653  ORF Transcript_25492/g.60653 Transcript_25492/m.60653 type:complete len:89 (-) Transcript_25492:146-412(-)
MAVQLSGGGCLQALLGICWATAKLGELKASASGSKKHAVQEEVGEPDEHDLARHAAGAVLSHYRSKCPGKLPLVERLLRSQGLLGAEG